MCVCVFRHISPVWSQFFWFSHWASFLTQINDFSIYLSSFCQYLTLTVNTSIFTPPSEFKLIRTSKTLTMAWLTDETFFCSFVILTWTPFTAVALCWCFLLFLSFLFFYQMCRFFPPTCTLQFRYDIVKQTPNFIKNHEIMAWDVICYFIQRLLERDSRSCWWWWWWWWRRCVLVTAEDESHEGLNVPLVPLG